MKKIFILVVLMFMFLVCSCQKEENVEYSDTPINQVSYVKNEKLYFSIDFKGKRYNVNLTEYNHYTDGNHWRADVDTKVEYKNDEVVFNSDVVMARISYVRGSTEHMVGNFYIYFTEYEELYFINVLIENDKFDELEFIEVEFSALPNSSLLNHIKQLIDWSGE